MGEVKRDYAKERRELTLLEGCLNLAAFLSPAPCPRWHPGNMSAKFATLDRIMDEEGFHGRG